MSHAGAIYAGAVVHQRLRPRRHRLRYRVFSLLLDIDRLDDLAGVSRLFAHNRRGLVSFYDRDHGPGTDGPLRPWVEAALRGAGIDLGGGAIRLLCYPRILGYVFNPLSVYFCHDATGDLAAILYEVHNTFGERHTYVIPVDPAGGPVIRQSCDKEFYVSPFIPMDCRYRFSMVAPDERVVVTIREEDADGLLLAASFAGRRVEFDDRRLAAQLLRHPLMTVKVIAGIHVEALRLWLKGLRTIQREPIEGHGMTVVGRRPLSDR